MENYFQNIAYQNTYPIYLRFLLAFAVRIVENICSFFVDIFILAEKCYATELEFVQKNYIILENKFAIPKEFTNISPKNKTEKPKNSLIFIHSGTISQSYGSKEAIIFVKQFVEQYPTISVQLILIGFCSNPSYYAELQALSKNISYISWQISTQKPVAHQHILEAIAKADIALVPYQINPSNIHRIPTKFYEYIYFRVPMLLSNNTFWVNFCEQYAAALPVDFQDISKNLEIYAQIFNIFFEKLNYFYSKKIEETEILWTEKDKQICKKIFKIG
jgi:hypothetical protein